MVGAPRTDKNPRTAIVQFGGETYEIKYVGLTMREDRECRDGATVISASGGQFKPFLYIENKIRKMVVEIAGEPVTEEAALWNELPDGFGDALREALMPDEAAFFRGDSGGG
jgi:hypothetical protein